MSDQIGFDFGGDHVPAYALQPEGSWLAPKHTRAELEAIFAKAESLTCALPEAARPLFLAGVAEARAQLEHMADHLGDRMPAQIALWRSNFEVEPDQLRAFVSLCMGQRGRSIGGIEYKARDCDSMIRTSLVLGMHVQGAGSIVVHQWGQDNIGIDYKPYRAHLFLPSYLDEIREVFEPCTTWAKAYCADKLSEAGDSAASVPAFTINGREYINTGGMSSGSYRSCQACTFVPASEWLGPTFTYQGLIRAFDEGMAERGDRRGLLVKVRGQQCVIDGVTLVYDDQASRDVVLFADEEGEQQLEMSEA